MATIIENIRYINLLIYIINTIGLVGNIFSFIVFSKKAFAKSSIRFYGTSLAIFDSFVVIKLGFGIASLIMGVDLFNQNIIACNIIYKSLYMLSPIPGWILIAFSIDQLISACSSQRLAFVKTRIFQYGFIIGVFLLHCLAYSSVTFTIVNQNVTSANLTVEVKQCRLNTRTIYPSVFISEPSLLPFLLIILLTGIMLKWFVCTRRQFEQVATDPNEVTRASSDDTRWRFNSLLLNIVFFVLVFPLISLLVFFMLDDFYENELRTSIILAFWYLNFASHFWIHFAANSVFRNEILVLFRFRNREDY